MTTIDTPRFEPTAADLFEQLDEIGELGDVGELGEPENPSWRRGTARCSDGRATLVHLFFSDDEFDIARAKAICSRCTLRSSCLAGALERREAYGVWGGELVVEGMIIAVKRGRGRPPKHPRPALVVDEVPVPPHLVA
jgi:WhiB family transcriptional regulator, redox-sensing transcriptional regulator